MEHNEHISNAPQTEQKILLEIPNAIMHRFVKEDKSIFTSGQCNLCKMNQDPGQPIFYISFNQFQYPITKQLFFVKLVYSDSVSYLFPHYTYGLSSITLPSHFDGINNIDEILSSSSLLMDYAQAIQNTNIAAKIEQNCRNINQKPIYRMDTLKKVISYSGKILNSTFSTAGGYLKTGLSKIGNFLSNKIEAGQPTHLRPQTKQRWQKVRNGTNFIVKSSGQIAAKIISPIIDKTYEYGRQIKNKIEHSDNENIRYAKQLLEVSGLALGDAYEGIIKGGNDITSQFTQQTKQIIAKKYGEELLTLGDEQKTESNKSLESQESQPTSNSNTSGELTAEGESGENLGYVAIKQ